MKILYAIQGTGNGHIARANELIRHLRALGEVHTLVSGFQSQLKPAFTPDIRLKGMSFVFGRNGGIDYWSTFRKNDLGQFLKDVRSLPVKDYDMVLSDFEPVSLHAAHRAGVPTVGFGNQYALLLPEVPKPNYFAPMGKWVIRNYASAERQIACFFRKYSNRIFNPTIGRDVRNASFSDQGYFLLYLPSYGIHQILDVLQHFPKERFVVFTGYTQETISSGNVRIEPVVRELFTEHLLHCRGLITNGGFATPAEALYLGKRLLSIPMKGQYEQQCNAAGLQDLGVTVLHDFSVGTLLQINDWLVHGKAIRVRYDDDSPQLAQALVAAGAGSAAAMAHLHSAAPA